MNFDDLAAFCTVIETKNFAKAARQLYLSTPVMTKRIARLESHLGARLLQRTTRQVSATEAGAAFYEQAVQILQQLDSSKKLVKGLTSEVSGILKIGLPASISHLHITPALKKFLKKYPKLKLQIVNGNHLLDLLRCGFDIVVYCGSLPDSSFHYKKLGDWNKVTCASPSYLSHHGTPKNLDELSQHNCLDHYDSFTKSWRFKEKGKTREIMIHGNIYVNSNMELRDLAVAGLGIAHLPSFTIQQELQTGKLVPILEKYAMPDLGIYAVYPSQQFLSQKMKVFLDFLATLSMGNEI